GSGRTWMLALVAAVAGGLLATAAAGALSQQREVRLMPGPPAAAPSAAAPAIAVTIPTAQPTSADAATRTPIEGQLDNATPDLTGTYAADNGGIFYVRQRDNVVWWSGMSSRYRQLDEIGGDWSQVGRGVLAKDLTIKADWVDVPRGATSGDGTVDLKVVADA